MKFSAEKQWLGTGPRRMVRRAGALLAEKLEGLLPEAGEEGLREKLERRVAAARRGEGRKE